MALECFSQAELIEELIPFYLYKVKLNSSIYPTKELICVIVETFNFDSFRGEKIPLVLSSLVNIKFNLNKEYGCILSK
tara:strand:- start:7151 stop:7384 length:234 start_codon:yes stop_codon:yes gene_type:complete